MGTKTRKIAIVLTALSVITIATLIFHHTQSFYKDFARGRRFFKKTRYQKALIYLTSAANTKPDSPESLRYLVSTYEKLGREKDVLEKLQALSQLGQDDLETKRWLADIYYGLGDFAKAEESYRQLLSSKRDPLIQRKLAEVLAWQKRYDQSVNILEQLPENQENIELLADVYTWSENYDKAIMLYSRLIASKEANPDIILKLADTLRLAKRDKEAIVLYKQYIRTHDEL